MGLTQSGTATIASNWPSCNEANCIDLSANDLKTDALGALAARLSAGVFLNSLNSTAGKQRSIRSAIVGTGFIADFHARGIKNYRDAELVAVCDTNLKVAEAFGAGRGAKAYASIDEMLSQERIDVVHVLTPPDLHHSLAKKALQAGVNVFVEKPMCVSTEETKDLLETARASGVRIGVNHSMLFVPAYDRLRNHVRAGDIGPIDYLNITHFSELGVIRLGPFSNWIVREPQNALLEIGSHLVSELIDLVGEPDDMTCLGRPRRDASGRWSRLPPLANSRPRRSDRG